MFWSGASSFDLGTSRAGGGDKDSLGGARGRAVTVWAREMRYDPDGWAISIENEKFRWSFCGMASGRVSPASPAQAWVRDCAGVDGQGSSQDRETV